MTHNKANAAELVRVKARFQQRSILAAMGIATIAHCKACGAINYGCDHSDLVAAGIAHPDDAGR